MNILCKVFLCTPRIDPRDSVRILVEETLRSICEEACGPRAFPLKVQTRLAQRPLGSLAGPCSVHEPQVL